MERATQERLVGATLLIVAGVIMIPWLLDGDNADRNVTERELVLPGGSDSGNETRRISLEVPRPDRGASESSVREIDARSVRDVDEPAATMNLPTPKPATASTSSAATSSVPARFAKPMPESADSSNATSAPAKNPQATNPQTDVTKAPAPVRNEVASLPKPVPVRADEPQPSVSKPPVEETKPAAQPVAQTTAPLRDEPKPATPVPVASSGKVWAVQVGSFASQENAERLVELLRSKSYKAFVMRNTIGDRVLYRVRIGPVNERSEADLLATALREDRQPARVLSHP